MPGMVVPLMTKLQGVNHSCTVDSVVPLPNLTEEKEISSAPALAMMYFSGIVNDSWMN